MTRLSCCFLFLLVAVPAFAQTAVPVTTQHKLAWTQQAPDLAAAQGYTYTLYVDGAAGVPVAATCQTVNAAVECQVPFPALTPGDHALVLTASQMVDGVTLTSAPSAPLRVHMYIAPSAPLDLRIVRPSN